MIIEGKQSSVLNWQSWRVEITSWFVSENSSFVVSVIFLIPGVLVIAKADYLGKTGNDLSFSEGDQIRLFSKVDEYWWHGAIRDQQGYIPIQYVNLPEK